MTTTEFVEQTNATAGGDDGYGSAAAAIDPRTITQVVVDALRHVVELAIGAAVADGRFDERVKMILAEGVQVAVGETKFWVNVFEHGDQRIRQLAAAAVTAAADECAAQAHRLAARMPDGSMVWKDGDLLAQGARHCEAYVRCMAPHKPYEVLNELDQLRKRDERWRAAVTQMLAVEPEAKGAVHALAQAKPAELTEEGRAAQAWAKDLTELLKRRE